MRRFSITAMLALAVAIAACNSVPIVNVDSAAVPPVAGKQPTKEEEVRTAIVRAGSALGWQMKDDGPNESGGNIHKNYNGWIQNLNKGINTQLGLL